MVEDLRHLARSGVALLLITACGAPEPAVEVTSVEELGPMEVAPIIGGRDGGYSGMAFGRSVWLYGDTILTSADVDGSTWHNNSWSWTEDLDARDGLTGFSERTDAAGAPELLLSLTPEEVQFNEDHADSDEAKVVLWPAGLVSDEARGRVLVFYVKIIARPGAFDFEAVGTSIAVWEGEGGRPQRALLGVGSEPTLLFGGDDPELLEGAVVHEDRLYAYDCRGLSKGCVVGRAPLADALERDAWRFWDGDGWTVGGDEEVFDGNDIMSVHFNAELGSFVAIYSRPFSNEVAYRTAPAPEGPWSADGDLFTAMAPDDGDTSYSAVGHAELQAGGDELVSYHRGTAPFRSEIRLVRVSFR